MLNGCCISNHKLAKQAQTIRSRNRMRIGNNSVKALGYLQKWLQKKKGKGMLLSTTTPCCNHVPWCTTASEERLPYTNVIHMLQKGPDNIHQRRAERITFAPRICHSARPRHFNGRTSPAVRVGRTPTFFFFFYSSFALDWCVA